MTVQSKDIGFSLAAATGLANGAATAAGTGDDTEKVGAILDYKTLNHALSGSILIPWTATLQDTETISLTTKIEHGDAANLSDKADYAFGCAEINHGVIGTGETGGTTEVGVVKHDVDLSGIKRYFRIAVTPDLSASGTDTAEFAGCLVLGGLDKAPVS